MNRMLVAVFDNEPKAFEGLSALKALHDGGDITLYGTAVLVKDSSGKVSTKRATDPGPVGTAVGMFAGSMVGLLAGPVGLAVGASFGGLAGLLFDLEKTGTNIQFVDDVSRAMTPGKTAVLADVEENWTTPVDTRIGTLGGTVFRRPRYEVVDDQLAREAAATEQEIKDLKEELSQAHTEHKAAIQKQLDDAKKKLQATRDQIRSRIDQARRDVEAKMTALGEQLRQAHDRQKGRVEKRIAAVKADLEARIAKLEAAGKTAMEALTV